MKYLSRAKRMIYISESHISVGHSTFIAFVNDYCSVSCCVTRRD